MVDLYPDVREFLKLGKWTRALTPAVFAMLLLLAACSNKKLPPEATIQTISRSRVADGNLSRLQHALAKARRGEPVTVGFVGGSITWGEGATPSHDYVDLVSNWWRENFPQSKVTLVNAGIRGTGSNYGCLRLNRDLLTTHPDFVVVEFGVNDKDDQAHAQTYEGVVRQLLSDPDQPAVVLLFLMHHDGTNAQIPQSQIGQQYGIPMISYRDALWPEIQAGRLKWTDVTADVIHPNDRGHAAIAAFLTSLLQDTLDELPRDSALLPTSTVIAAPKFTDLYEHTKLINSADIAPAQNTGWTYEAVTKSWRSDAPGSVIEFEVAGQSIDLLYQKQIGGFGTASVTVDSNPPVLCDSWLNGFWGPLCQTDRLYQGTSTGKHRVRIELLKDKNILSTGHEFRILGFGVAGTRQ